MMPNRITIEKARTIANTLVYSMGDWRAKMPHVDALDLAIADPGDIAKRANNCLHSCDDDITHAIACAVKDRMEIAANWYDSTGFRLCVA